MTIPIWPFRSAFLDLPDDPLPSSTSATVVPASPKAVLHYYSTPGVSPPSARFDPKLKRQERRPIRLWHLWKYGLVVASKATEMTGDILIHHIWGPRRKSWGIEMTIINSFMRGAGRHSSLVDINTIRMLMSLGGLVPLPSDALVTPVTFRVKRRNLRGILADFDSKEDGSRELSGEWVVGKRAWQKLQSGLGANNAQRASPPDADPLPATSSKASKHYERVVLYIHGGAYYLSSAAAQRLISIPLAKYTEARVFALDYRLAPESRFPGPLHDVVSGYFRLVEDLHIPPENIIVCGDSAGGGLSLALLMYLRDNGYPLPSSAILMSPWVDLTMSCESWESNAPYDVVPFPAPDDHLNPVALYLGENMEQYYTHPYASPLFGDFKGLPPLLIQAGEAEVLRDEITLLAHKASLAGVEVRHELYEDAVHVFQLYPFLDSASRAFLSMREFVRHILPSIQSRLPQELDSQAEKVIEDEIVNESATLVRGDGVETAVGKEEVEQELEHGHGMSGFDILSSDEDAISSQRHRHYPSWGRTSSWSISPLTDDEDDDEDEDEGFADGDDENESAGSSANPSLTTSSIRRIRSAMSLIMPGALSPVTPALHSGKQSAHKRTMSYQALKLPEDDLLTPNLTRSGRDERPTHIPIPPSSMPQKQSVPPSPSVRRRGLSNASHPDISNLVSSWTQSGPANQTVLYTPHEHNHRH